MLSFRHHHLAAILEALQRWSDAAAAGEVLEFRVPNPDLGRGHPGGTLLEDPFDPQLGHFRHRSYRNWIDVAEILSCRMLTPIVESSSRIVLRFERLPLADKSPANEDAAAKESLEQERYGAHSAFYGIQKLEEPHFYQDLCTAYQRVRAESAQRVLDLGVHRGDELLPLAKLWEQNPKTPRYCLGIDHCPSAIAEARQRFCPESFEFRDQSLQEWLTGDEDPFDLLISIGTLQCRGVDGKSLFPGILRRYLKKGGAVILGFPNLRYLDGELRLGGKMRNFTEVEHSLVFKDVMFYRKLLQRRADRVVLTGRYYLFVTAWSVSRREG